MKALLAQRKRFEGQESPHLNIIIALKVQKEQFEGPKPTLKYYQGAEDLEIIKWESLGKAYLEKMSHRRISQLKQ
jgi:hypothetical protein